jgi:hypothetical protein
MQRQVVTWWFVHVQQVTESSAEVILFGARLRDHQSGITLQRRPAAAALAGACTVDVLEFERLAANCWRAAYPAIIQDSSMQAVTSCTQRGCWAPAIDADAPDLQAVGDGYPTHRRCIAEPYPHRMRTDFDARLARPPPGSDGPTPEIAGRRAHSVAPALTRRCDGPVARCAAAATPRHREAGRQGRPDPVESEWHPASRRARSPETASGLLGPAAASAACPRS